MDEKITYLRESIPYGSILKRGEEETC